MSWLTSQKARLIVIAGLSWLYTTFVCTFHVHGGMCGTKTVINLLINIACYLWICE